MMIMMMMMMMIMMMIFTFNLFSAYMDNLDFVYYSSLVLLFEK